MLSGAIFDVIGSNFGARRIPSGEYDVGQAHYAGRLENLAEVQVSPRHRFVGGDIADAAVSAPLVRRFVQISTDEVYGSVPTGRSRETDELRPRNPYSASKAGGDGLNVRDWLHVDDHCRAIDLLITKAENGEVCNIGGGNEVTNRDLTHRILELTGRPTTLIKPVKDRLGHDRRYALDTAKVRSLG